MRRKPEREFDERSSRGNKTIFVSGTCTGPVSDDSDLKIETRTCRRIRTCPEKSKDTESKESTFFSYTCYRGRSIQMILLS